MNITEIVNQYTTGVRDFSGIDLREANLMGLSLPGSKFQNALLSVANLSNANFNGTDFSQAKLNVARLSDANFKKTILNQAILNVANLIRANLEEAEITEALLIKVEAIRVNCKKANLTGSNFNGSDLREANFTQANLTLCDLTETNLRGAIFQSALLEKANLNGANISRADCQEANFQYAELRQTNFSRADLRGADFRGANLRWSDLSGANLRGANLQGAKLSGVNLMGADLSEANLRYTSLVHADLTQARLTQVDWLGADLSGANLTGSKLYGVSRVGLKTEGLVCEWIDLSIDGDRTEVYRFSPEQVQKFFHQTQPQVKITIDASLTFNANLLLASIYQKIAQFYPEIKQPPSIQIRSKKTVLTFKLDSNEHLLITAFLMIFPFNDREITQDRIFALIKLLEKDPTLDLTEVEQKRINLVIKNLESVNNKLATIPKVNLESLPSQTAKFFQAPTQTLLTNSSDEVLDIYHHPQFGKSFSAFSTYPGIDEENNHSSEIILPTVQEVLQFINTGGIFLS